MRYVANHRPFDLEATLKFLEWAESYQKENGFCRWKIVERSSGRMIGSCGLARPHGTEEIELGYLLRRDSWGHGFATEAARACMLYGFNNLGFREIIAMTEPENIASQKVLEKIGFTVRGIETYKGEENLVYFAENPASIYE